ncbi:MAG: hypothetical protein A2Y14_05930 [Verrucomicrobia bacterium GWF2_51_19]|nr:MAG: hypothetical protein A2Y14_05930 [Verrucomicrobia bacterium GWF2_51_19]HCJ12118.1 hypothetical protein [Opitutae bacterium]
MLKMKKILAIKFKYLGDVAVAIPSLRALREAFPKAALHVLVAEEAAPLIKHLDWIDRIWEFPRKRGHGSIRRSLPLLLDLRKEHFDRSVDFVGNDRGALLSRLIGAQRRLGVIAPKGFWGRRFCYTERIEEADLNKHEIVRDLMVLQKWDIPFPLEPRIEIRPNPALQADARSINPYPVLAHISTSQPKKEWPLEHWNQLYELARKAHIHMCFSAGPSDREQALLRGLKRLNAYIPVLEKIPDLETFIAVLAQSKVLISPDTAPLHIAAGLDIATIALFGATASHRWAPLGSKHVVLQGELCPCSGHAHTCQCQRHCMATIRPETVFNKLKLASTNF